MLEYSDIMCSVFTFVQYIYSIWDHILTILVLFRHINKNIENGIISHSYVLRRNVMLQGIGYKRLEKS